MQVINRTLAEWLHHLEHRYPCEVHLRLMNSSLVAKRLGVLDISATVITVAGTNGKGSTVAALEEIYCTAGYRVGVYTSPHLFRFNERIKLNQQPISDEELCRLFEIIERARAETPLTYFETATLAALLYFKAADLDVMILEVGVGGRLDATNIVDPDLAMITTVDLDHQDYLGADIESIAREKAGIMREKKPLIYADHRIPQAILETASERNAVVYALGEAYDFTLHHDLTICTQKGYTIRLPPPNIHVNAAAAAVFATTCLADSLPVAESDLIKAIQGVRVPGRLQCIQAEVDTLFDVSHNPQAVRVLVKWIQTHYANRRIHAVFSGLKDKDIAGLIQPMAHLVTHWYPVELTGSRATSQSELLRVFRDVLNQSPSCFDDPTMAYRAAVERASVGDLVVVYGSFLVVAPVMAMCSEVCV